MSGPTDDQDRNPTGATDPTPAEELREGLSHFFKAAQKVVKSVEPQVNEGLSDVERLLGKLGRGGEAMATEVGKEVATLTTRLADRLRALTDRPDSQPPPPKDDKPEGGR